MKEEWSVRGSELAPVLSRKDIFEANIGPFVTPFFISCISRKYDSKFKQNVITQFWNYHWINIIVYFECFQCMGVDDKVAYYLMVTTYFYFIILMYLN